MDACQLERRLLFSGSPIGDQSDWDVQDLAADPSAVDLDDAHGFDTDKLSLLGDVPEFSPYRIHDVATGTMAIDETDENLRDLISSLPSVGEIPGTEYEPVDYVEGGEVLSTGPVELLATQFQASTETSGQQSLKDRTNTGHNSVAIAPNGDYVVVWSDNSSGDWDVKARLFNRFGRDRGTVGTTFTVNDSLPGDQSQARVGIADDGRFVVSWTDGTDIFFRRMNADGDFLDATDVLATGAAANERHTDPDIAVNASGDFVLVWREQTLDGSLNSIAEAIQVRQLSFDLAQNTLVPIDTGGELIDPVVGMDAVGNAVVVWVEDEHFVRAAHIVGGSAQPNFLVAQTTFIFTALGQRVFPAVDMNAAGEFAISWTEESPTTGGNGEPRVAIYDALGTSPIDDIFTKATDIIDDGFSSVQLNDAGEILVAWEGTNSNDIFYRRFAATPTAINAVDASEVKVNLTTGGEIESSAAVAMLDHDNFIVLWMESAGTQTIQARQYGPLFANPAEAPTISAISDTSVLVDTSTAPIAFTISDPNTPIGSLNVTAVSDNQTLIPDANIALGGTDANRTISITPATTEVGGSVQISVEVEDGPNIATETFNVQVVPRVVTVTTVVDELDVDPLTTDILSLASNPGGTGVSLREAIYAVNNTMDGATPDKIHFDIPGAGPHRINLNPTVDSAVALPTITDDVIVDGTTEPDFNSLSGNPIVELDGASLGGNHNGLNIAAGDVTVRGLSIGGFSGDGIRLGSGNNNTIQGNWIGVASDGTPFGNGRDGVQIDGSSDNTIGGVATGEANTISNSARTGINVLAGTGNTLRGNVISGNTAMAIDLDNDGPNNNDLLDLDSGPNRRQNRPVIGSASLNGNGDLQVVALMLGESPPPPLLIDFYVTTSPNGSTAWGGAERWLGSGTHTGNGFGILDFVEVLSGSGVSPGEFITVTATDPSGNTSEFSPVVAAALVTPAGVDLDVDDSSGAVGNDYLTQFSEGDAPVSLADMDPNATATAVGRVDINVTGIQDADLETIQLDGSVFPLATDVTAFITSGQHQVDIITAPGAGTATIRIYELSKGYFDAADVEALVQAVTYQHTADVSPTDGSRFFDIQLVNGVGTGPIAQTEISVGQINEAPVFSDLDAAFVFDPSNPIPTVLDADVTVSDEELDALGGAGNYDGATLDVRRATGANSEDTFGATGTLDPLTEGVGNLAVQGISIGDVDQNSSGDLRLTFNANATTSLVNELIQQITYVHSDPTPEEGVIQIDFLFGDGNTGSQGPGGPLTALGNVTIALTNPPNLDLDSDDSSGATNNDFQSLFVEDVTSEVTLADADVSLTDLDSSQFTEVTIDIAGIQDGSSEVLRLDGSEFALAATTTSTTTLGGQYVVSITPGAVDTASVTIVGSGGSFSVAETESLVGSLRYSHLESDAPTDGNRIFGFRVNDGMIDSELAEATIALQSTNDPPVNAGPVSLMTAEDVPVVFSTGNGNAISISDVDAAASTGLLEVAIGVTNGTLTLNGTTGLAIVAGADGSSSVTIQGSEVDINTALDGLSYQPATNFSGSDALAIATSDLGNSGSGGVLTDSLSVAITVNAINDAPILDNSGSMTLVNINEDDIDSAGNTVAAIVSSAGGDRITDADTGAIEGIAVTAIDDTNGTWQYSIDGGTTWIGFGAPSTTSATLLGATSVVRFVPNQHYNGSAGDITFHAWDQTSGSIGATGVNVTTTSGATAFSAAVETATLNILAVNDVPSFTNLGGNPSQVFDTSTGTPVVLDPNQDVTIADAELDAIDDYAGATVLLQRNGGANSDDLFGASGTLAFTGGNVELNSIVVGTFTNAGGQLQLTFNSNATSTAVDQVLQQLTYANANAAATETSIQVDYLFTDTGSPSLNTTGNVTVNLRQPPTLDLDSDDSSGATGDDFSTSFNEGSLGISIADDVDLADLDSTDFSSVTLAVSGLREPANEILEIDGVVIDLGTSVPPVTTTSNYEVTITIGASNDADIAIVNNAGTFTETQVESLLGSITYRHQDDVLPTSGQRFIDVQVNDGTLDSAIARSEINVVSTNEAPSFSNLGGATNPIFDIRASVPVLLDQDVTVSDEELETVAIGTYESATLTLARNGGPNSDDVFGTSGTLSFSGGNIEVDSTIVGTVTNGAQLVLTFDNNATPALVDRVLQQITYDNLNPSPSESSIQIDYVLNDGNNGSQGSGPALSTTQSVVVDVIASTPPSLDLDDDDSSFTTGNDYERDFYESVSPVRIADTDVNLSDPDSTSFPSITLTINGIQDGNEELIRLNTASVGLGSSTAATTSMTSFSGNFDVTLTPSPSGATNTIVITKTLGGTFQEVEVEDLLGALRYEHTDADIPSAGLRTIDVTVDDEIGTSLASTSTIRVIPVNDRPVIGNLDSTPTFFEGSPAVILDSDVVVDDVELDSTNYDGSSFIVTRSGGANPNDFFSATSGTPVTGGVVSNGGITFGSVVQNSGGRLEVLFNSNATSALVEDALRQITFSTTDMSSPSISLDFVFDDGNIGAQGINAGPSSTTRSIAVGIVPLNQAPILDLDLLDGGILGPDYWTTFVEGSAPIDIVDVGDVVVSDPDGSTLTELELTVSGILDGNSESIFIDGVRFDLATSVASQVTSHGFLVDVAVGPGTADVTINRTGDFTETEAVALLESIQYQHQDSEDPQDGDRLVVVRVSDGIAYSQPATSFIDLIPVNDAPTLTSFSPTLGGTEDTTLAITFSDLVGLGNESDVDGTIVSFKIEGADEGMLRIGANASTAELWALGTNDTIDGTNNAYWTPPTNENGPNNSLVVSATDNDGASSAPVVLPINLSPVNDLPTANPDSFAVVATDDLIIAAPDLTGNDSDPEGDPLNVVITVFPQNGSLTFSANGEFAVYRANDPGFSGVDTFTYVAREALAGGGDSNPVTVTIDVTSVALPPDPQGPGPDPVDPDPGGGDPGGDEPTDDPDAPTTSIFSTSDSEDDLDPDEADRVQRRPNSDLAAMELPQILQFPEDVFQQSVTPFFKPERVTSRSVEAMEATLEVVASGADNISYLETQFTSLWTELDTMGEQLDTESKIPDITVGSIAGLSSMFTVGYVTWLVRGGHIAAGLLAQMPAWQFIDPLPVLAGLDDEEGDDVVDDTAESMFSQQSNQTKGQTSTGEKQTRVEDKHEASQEKKADA